MAKDKSIYNIFGGRKAFIVQVVLVVWVVLIWVDIQVFKEITTTILFFIGAYLGFNVGQKAVEKHNEDNSN